jgi:hypothetical protein
MMEAGLIRFTRYLVLAQLIAVLASPAPAIGKDFSRRYPITIGADRGGVLIRYATNVARYKKQRQPIRFAGRCSSACTLYLSLPSSQTCIQPGGHFVFHKAYGASARAIRMANAYLMRNYPGWVRRWISNKGGLTSSTKTMRYEYAVRYLPKC